VMMDAVSSSETSIIFYQTTQCKMPEDSHLNAITYFLSGL
jgi:hypothetical protein